MNYLLPWVQRASFCNGKHWKMNSDRKLGWRVGSAISFLLCVSNCFKVQMQHSVYHLSPQIIPWKVYYECQLLWGTFWILQVIPLNNDYSSSRNCPEWLVTWQTCGLSFVVNVNKGSENVSFHYLSCVAVRKHEIVHYSNENIFLPFIFSFISVYSWHFSKQAASSRSTICFFFSTVTPSERIPSHSWKYMWDEANGVSYIHDYIWIYIYVCLYLVYVCVLFCLFVLILEHRCTIKEFDLSKTAKQKSPI